jgi:hypothetical protein
MSVVLSQALVNRLFRDPKFFQKFPEFNGLKALKKPSTQCPKCDQTKLAAQKVGGFISVARSLAPGRKTALLRHIGTPALQIQIFNKASGKHEVRIIK